jgi:3-keto-disaccharide hydrolase
MKKALCLAVAVCLAFSSLAIADDGFKPIFDGKTLDGWKVNEDGKGFKVEDGTITGRGGRCHIFYVKEELKDFEMKVDVKINEGGNSGVYFHTAYQEDGWPEAGHEVQVNATHKDPVKTGSLYNVVKLYESPSKAGEWFTMHIAVKGDALRVSVNDKVLYEYVQPPGVTIPRRINKGVIAFQQHDPVGVVQYRSILLKK